MLGDIVSNKTTANQEPAHPSPAVSAPPIASVDVAPAAPVRPVLSRQSGSKVPLVLTVVGILVFVVGASGLFMYALSS